VIITRAIWLARHASRRDFDDPHWGERAPRPHDPPLSAGGQRQALAMADRLAGESVTHVFSSPFLRCVETAAPIAERLGLAIELEAGLSEWLNVEWFSGPLELLPAAELSRRFPVDVGYRSRGAARYAENGTEALERSGKTARLLAAEFDGSLVMVGHGASVLGVMAELLGVDVRQMKDPAYGSVIELVQSDGRWMRGREFYAGAPRTS
jgi:broad specificity phosphatase PhoE